MISRKPQQLCALALRRRETREREPGGREAVRALSLVTSRDQQTADVNRRRCGAGQAAVKTTEEPVPSDRSAVTLWCEKR